MFLDLPIIYHHLECTDSTNSWVKTHYNFFDLKRLHLISATQQTQGKGTHGKIWHSPKDVNIYATFFFSLPKGNPYQTLAQLLALSIANTLTSLECSPTIKWPNDILLNEKKICGVLCEITPLSEDLLVILGFGLNVNMNQTDCNSVDQPTTSLLISKGRSFATNNLLEKIALNFQENLILYLQKDFLSFCKHYNSYMVYKEYPVVFNGKLLGISQEVNVKGELIVKTPAGELIPFSYGSIKLH